jgi:hypothetical protein
MAQSEIAETKETVVVNNDDSADRKQSDGNDAAGQSLWLALSPCRLSTGTGKFWKLYPSWTESKGLPGGGGSRLLGTPKRGWPSQQTESYKKPPPRSRSSTAAQIILRDIMLLVSNNYCVC